MEDIIRGLEFQLSVLSVYSNRFLYIGEIGTRLALIEQAKGEDRVKEAKSLYYYIKSVQNTIVETEDYDLSMYWDAINTMKTLLIDIRKYYKKLELEREDTRPEIIKNVSKLVEIFNSRDCAGGMERAVNAYRQFMKTGEVE